MAGDELAQCGAGSDACVCFLSVDVGERVEARRRVYAGSRRARDEPAPVIRPVNARSRGAAAAARPQARSPEPGDPGLSRRRAPPRSEVRRPAARRRRRKAPQVRPHLLSESRFQAAYPSRNIPGPAACRPVSAGSAGPCHPSRHVLEEGGGVERELKSSLPLPLFLVVRTHRPSHRSKPSSSLSSSGERGVSSCQASESSFGRNRPRALFCVNGSSAASTCVC
jgi:hypothetical protein